MGAVFVQQEELDYIRALIQNIKVTNGDIKYWGSGKFAGINIICSAQSEPAATGYDGPFAVSKKDATTVTIAAGVLVLGLTTIEFAETDLTISAAGYAVIDITYANSAYSVAAANVSSLPTQTATHYYIILATVAFADSVIGAISQKQYGFIQGAGRIF